MTLEEKAKAYDEAIKKAKSKIKNNKDHVLYEEDITDIFPALKESEDEKIRKAIIEFFELQDDNTTYSLVPKKDIITWLKKQGDKNHTDRVEPKFHEGDWVFIEDVKGYKNGPFQIKVVDSFGYSFDEYHTIPFMYEDLLSKWTIQDVKAGDVLATKDTVFIFKYMDKTGLSLCKSYCEVIGNSKLGFGFNFSINNVYPATKEQHDTLMKAIADAGYTFDFEKKELIDTYCQDNCKGFQETGRCFCDGECKAKQEHNKQNR